MKRIFLAALALSAASSPARAQIMAVGSGVEERAAAPGETYSGTVRLRNNGAQDEEAKVYLTDYAFSADGTTRYPAAGSTARSSARWIVFTPAQVHLPAHGEATVGYTVTVPAGTPLSGTYWSMLMVEGIARGSAESTAAGSARVRVGLQPTTRYGVQIATTVGSTAPRVAFSNPRAFAGAHGKVFEVDLANAGEAAYRPQLRVELFDGAGHKAGTFTSRRGLLYPGTSLRQSFDLGDLPAGSYQALVVADAGGDQVFGAQYRLQL